MAYNKPSDTEADDRPRHVRLAHQELKKGGKLVLDYTRGAAAVLRSGIKNELTIEQGEEAREAIEEEHEDQITVIDYEKLTTAEIVEQWPGLKEHYKNPRQQISHYGQTGKLNKTSRGRGKPILIHIDETFLEWLGSLSIEAEPEAEEEPGEEDAPALDIADLPANGVNSEAPEKLEVVQQQEYEVVRRFVELRAAHVAHVKAVHSDADEDQSQEELQNACRRARAVLRVLRSRLRAAEEAAGTSEGAPSPRVDGALSRITGDETLQPKEEAHA